MRGIEKGVPAVPMHPKRLTTLLTFGAVAALSVAVASCGGGSAPVAGSHAKSHKSAAARTKTPDRATKSGRSPSHSIPSTTSTVPTTLPPTPTNTIPTSGFRGIYEFAGGNSAADATNPELAGVVLVYYWSQIEPQKGVFAWNLIDDDMAPWIAAGKKVILRISTSGSASWDPPYSANGTPAWVFADGARSVSDSGATLPVYWDPAYLADYQSFVQNLAAQFNGNSNVAFIEPGIGMGGETLPETNASASGIAAWQSDGYTNDLWLTTVEDIASFFETYFTKTPIYPLVDRTFFDGNSTDIDAVMSWFKEKPNWGLQDDGLTSSQTLSSDWSGAPLALEQLDPTRTTGDCLCADISNGLNNLHGDYLLLYQSDIEDPANAASLQQAAANS
jgi:hypothetical protein